MTVVLMRSETDCEEAAGGTATGRSWEDLHRALGKQGLPNSAENPLAGNPVNFKLALESLCFRCDEVGLSAILHGRATPGRVVVLLHDPSAPVLRQHWVVWAGLRSDGAHGLYWGDKADPRWIPTDRLARYVTAGWPNCVFEVVPVAKPAPWYRRILAWLGLCRG